MKNKMVEKDAEDVGIMAGFKDMMEMMEMEDDDMGDMDEEDRVASEVMGRSPKSPEILMNNLRGDMRSIDARVDELADMVGYRAAKDTPQEVLALLQPVLAQQQGIGAAPAAGDSGGAAGAGTVPATAGQAPAQPSVTDQVLSGLGEALFGSTGPRGGQHQGLAQVMVKSAVRNIGSAVGREIVRGVMGSILGGRKR